MLPEPLPRELSERDRQMVLHGLICEKITRIYYDMGYEDAAGGQERRPEGSLEGEKTLQILGFEKK